jgi:hypothetical protein
MTHAAVEIVRGKVNQVAQSLKQDINRQAVEAAGQNPEGSLALKPWMAGLYLESEAVETAKRLIDEAADGGKQLNKSEFCSVRNSLVVQLLLSNAKRSGDIAALRRNDVMEATVAPDQPDQAAEIYVSVLVLSKIYKCC